MLANIHRLADHEGATFLDNLLLYMQMENPEDCSYGNPHHLRIVCEELIAYTICVFLTICNFINEFTDFFSAKSTLHIQLNCNSAQLSINFFYLNNKFEAFPWTCNVIRAYSGERPTQALPLVPKMIL
jgi:heme/copper-type cytochrome/quinol oxidase subunit 4